MEPPIHFDTISALQRRLDLPAPLHPLITLIPTGNIKVKPEDIGRKVSTNLYKISFKIDFKGKIPYGRGTYDFEDGGLSFTGPHQFSIPTGDVADYDGYTLFFHPDFLRGYPLAKTIQQYGYFSYTVTEALYLSEKEKKIIFSIFDAMLLELENNIDHFSHDVMIAQLELLLNYSNRFYNRQFLTRKTLYNDLICQMNTYISETINTSSQLPTVQQVANHLQVSPRYLSDMLKSLTGMGTQQHIHHQLIEKAKEILLTTNATIAEIAYQLGFEHPQSFNKLFRQKTNTSPLAYRKSS
ncbi:helix-turn-helix domain-containing protein [Chitinophaga sancti]|uniref:Helix-turn-helix domain-containing protein n=1 Tax=Chitinophaga sancti TaxID=1004 RepID=A0A1K1S477_9BACT|nr:helix-turn-helix domain-containing protein [Chitinophaga sancti]WQD63711.1 helix-turn-helix transcriptional regulator [Chitinophaga sancti]WQG90664.1 helix-turn-helix transcriptional regulator [Chitinophaga sancti]SFW79248.1 Helix-turn-helix domain-containing protein [Chitinophaga sancti]